MTAHYYKKYKSKTKSVYGFIHFADSYQYWLNFFEVKLWIFEFMWIHILFLTFIFLGLKDKYLANKLIKKWALMYYFIY